MNLPTHQQEQNDAQTRQKAANKAQHIAKRMSPFEWIVAGIFAVTAGFAINYATQDKWVPAIWYGFVAYIVFGTGLFVFLLRAVQAEPPVAEAPTSVVRPWVMIKNIAFHLEEGRPFTVTMEFRNTGLVPAVNIAQKWRTGIQSKPLDLAEMPPLKLLPDSSLPLLAPGLIAFGDSAAHVVVTATILDDLRTGKAGAYTYGVLEYEVAGRPQDQFATGFCFKATAADLNGPPEMYGGPEGNYAK